MKNQKIVAMLYFQNEDEEMQSEGYSDYNIRLILQFLPIGLVEQGVIIAGQLKIAQPEIAL